MSDNVLTYSTQGVNWVELTNNSTDSVIVAATLANPTLVFEFYQGNTPVTTGVSGTLVAKMKWRKGRQQAPQTISLANIDTVQLTGVATQIDLSVSNLVGCDKVVVSVVQYPNMIGA